MLIVLVFAAIGLTVLSATMNWTSSTSAFNQRNTYREVSQRAAAALPPAKVRIAAVQAEDFPQFTEVTGTVRPVQRAVLAAKVMGASPIRVLTDVMLLESLPQTFVGLRNGVSLALVIVVVAEMFIGSTDGLGQRVINAQSIFNMPEMYAAIFTAGVLGYTMNLIFILVERHFVHWGGK